MPITKAQKNEIYKSLTEITQNSKSIVFVNFKGLKVSDATALRRKLKSEGVNFLVTKKTITKKALVDKGIEGTMPELIGELGLAYGTDLVAPAREVYAFQKKLKDGVKILGGVFEGKYMTQEEMTALAAIPSMQTLRGMFVNVINSPIQGLVIALSEVGKKKTA